MGDRTGLSRTDRTNGYEDSRGYMQAKKSKLADQNDEIREVLRNRHRSMKTDLFKGISINVNGRTKPTADELKRLILLNGGEYHPYYRYQKTKFMIATNLAFAKMKQLRPDDKIITPEWVTDSIAQGQLLPYKDYQIYAEEPQAPKVPSISQLLRPAHVPQESQARQVAQAPISKPETKIKLGESSKGPIDKYTNVAGPSTGITPMATLCGTSELKAIQDLLSEWVGCPEGITDEDTACVINFFYDLMSENNFHTRLYTIVEAFRERVVEYGNSEWIELYNNILTCIKVDLVNGDDFSQNLAQVMFRITPPNSST